MADPFVAEIRIFPFNFAPKGWAFCNGQIMPISQNTALFSLLGTTYGGDGRVNFALPDLRGRVPIHTGNGHTLGERGGEQAHTLTMNEMPQHIHFLNAATSNGDTPVAAGNMLGSFNNAFRAGSQTPVAVEPSSVSNVGGSQAHLNMQPYLALTFCIALQGIFPSQN